ncbi:MAG: glycosyltransferase family 2 protein [Chloroflexi bacterium]|nr:glycosyltransferase family 2 protein [Chloroflexota bacterium]
MDTVANLGIIIVSWNTAELLADCLRSIPSGLDGIEAEIIVVDNGSTDGTLDLIAHDFPQIRLLQNHTNVGFARANNQGIGALGERNAPQYVLLLNSDTVAKSGSLRELVRFMEEHPDVGIVGPRLVRPNGKPQPYGFGHDPSLVYLINRGIKALLLKRYLHDWSTDQVQRVDWVSGACLLIRREALSQIGPLDEGFFMYFEDNDWCLRVRQAGWHVIYYPKVEVVHLGGQSLAKNPLARAAYTQSLLHFYNKHYGMLATSALRFALWGYNLLYSSCPAFCSSSVSRD